MKDSAEIISDFEELFKLREFHKDKKRLPFECTYEQISRTLKNEYVENIDDKIERWMNISHVLYFKKALSVRFYLQAKMLFRDGFYEAAITMSRSICEIICYELLLKQNHPFGEFKDLELENFRTLVKYLALPKSIQKEEFEKNVLDKIVLVEDRNYLKSSYRLDSSKDYQFKIENGKKAKNLNRFFDIFRKISFNKKDNFPNVSFERINKVYDDGNTYVHARKSQNTPKEDAINSLNGIGEVLYELYRVNESLEQKNIVTGYKDFPDICKGMNFALEAYASPEDAMRGYYNLPSQKQVEKLVSVSGVWFGEWKLQGQNNQKGKLTFYMEGEYLKANLEMQNKNNNEIEHLDIKLFGEYFHLIGFDFDNKSPRKQEFDRFKLEFLNDETLVGKHLKSKGSALFRRTKKY